MAIATYAPPSHELPAPPIRRRPQGGRIIAVQPGSPAALAGIRPGDYLFAINGHRLHDVIDYRFYSSVDAPLTVTIERDQQRLDVFLEEASEASLGIDFAGPLFTSIRRCTNDCDFCFVDMNPTGLRPSLYIRDDDYRLSFLFGDFITLTNLNDYDWTRIAEQHLSPLYVSVHATDTAVRRKMLANPRARPILEDLDRLATSGIQVHCQVVLCPSINDGAILERTITDLLDRYPQVHTVGIVPVGLTQFDAKYRLAGMARLTKAQARAVINQVTPLQRAYRSRYNESVLFLSDEMYLLAQHPIPSAQSYNGYPQYENGIGMIRSWRDSFTRWVRSLHRKHHQGFPLLTPALTSATIVTGHLFAPVLSETTATINALLGTELHVIAITNEFLGEDVTVAGLLAGQDIVKQLRGKHLGKALLLPGRALDQTGTYFLDGTSKHDVEHTLDVPVLPGREWRDFLRLLQRGE
ncbi:MAG: DUF512 domain-containing protein [Chloroflexi bacterium]|nr:DUF512 domain-containing protein [Chloroflexota bacterium]